LTPHTGSCPCGLWGANPLASTSSRMVYPPNPPESHSWPYVSSIFDPHHPPIYCPPPPFFSHFAPLMTLAEGIFSPLEKLGHASISFFHTQSLVVPLRGAAYRSSFQIIQGFTTTSPPLSSSVWTDHFLFSPPPNCPPLGAWVEALFGSQFESPYDLTLPSS